MKRGTRAVWLSALVGVVGCAPGEHPREFVFVSVLDGDFEIMRGAVGDTTLVNLSHDPGLDYAPRWSSDGSRVLFYSNRSGDDEIYALDPATGDLENVTDHPARDFDPAPGPDGRLVFVSDRDGNRELYLAEAGAPVVRRLTHNDHYDGGATWSPDGRHIAFSSSPDGAGDIHVLTFDSGELRRVVDVEGHADSPSWSPNGAWIAFNVAAGDTVAIHVVRPDGTDLRRLGNVHPDERHPRWSPDGEWLLYTATRVVEGDLDSDVWMMRPDGTERRPVVQRAGRDEFAFWRPLR